ncbi:hypothetical protein PCLA_09f0167 [Pseudomonas citronellolis]|nr:hypothetical protein PCLA_09f0167 [Pseudomonas citronellolis]
MPASQSGPDCHHVTAVARHASFTGRSYAGNKPASDHRHTLTSRARGFMVKARIPRRTPCPGTPG